MYFTMLDSSGIVLDTAARRHVPSIQPAFPHTWWGPSFSPLSSHPLTMLMSTNTRLTLTIPPRASLHGSQTGNRPMVSRVWCDVCLESWLRGWNVGKQSIAEVAPEALQHSWIMIQKDIDWKLDIIHWIYNTESKSWYHCDLSISLAFEVCIIHMPPKASHKKGATAPSQSVDDLPPKRAKKKTTRVAAAAASLSDSENGSGDENQKDVVEPE